MAAMHGTAEAKDFSKLSGILSQTFSQLSDTLLYISVYGYPDYQGRPLSNLLRDQCEDGLRIALYVTWNLDSFEHFD